MKGKGSREAEAILLLAQKAGQVESIGLAQRVVGFYPADLGHNGRSEKTII